MPASAPAPWLSPGVPHLAPASPCPPPPPSYLRACVPQEAALLEDVAVQYSSTYEFVGAGSATAKAFGELFDALVGRPWGGKREGAGER